MSLVNKVILVTGGTGSIGVEIVRKVLQYEPKAVRIFSNDENGLFKLEQELQSYPNVRFLQGDVKDKERLRMAVESTDFIFHAAALKHVRLCEYNPFEAIKINVIGTQNVIEVAMDEEVEKLVIISSDKAINPVSVMGATKLLAERLAISADYYRGSRQTVFCCVRFGNVLKSRGSVVPICAEQIKSGGPVTITDPDMTRFVMSISKAADLVLRAAEMAQGGDTFILKMPALCISDLAEVMIEELAPRYGYDPTEIRVEIISGRAGEKTHEQLMSEEEALNAYEVGEMFLLPRIPREVSQKKAPQRSYISKDSPLLSKQEIRKLLRDLV